MAMEACRVKSSEASSRTIRKRTRTLSELRTCISGGDNTVQLKSELRALSKEERDSLLLEAKLPVEIPPNYALAMKADLALPWAKMRAISR